MNPPDDSSQEHATSQRAAHRSDSLYRAAAITRPLPESQQRLTPRRALPPWLLLLASAGALFVVIAGCSLGTSVNGTQGNPTGLSNAGQTAPTVAVPPAAQDLQQTVMNVIRTVQPSVVQIESASGNGNGAIGSGEIVTSDGYIVTNDHVVRGFSSYSVTLSSGAKLDARLVGEAAQDDLAVLKVNSTTGLLPINFADSSKVQVGQFAIALGSPLGLTQSATFGIVSALNRTASEGQSGPAGLLTGLIQTSAPINPGNSGGALVDLQGRLIGVPTLGAANPESGSTADGIGFAIPSNRVKFVVDQLIKYGHLVNTGQGFMGIIGSDVTPQSAAANNFSVDHGVLITDFVNDASGKSPARQAGLQTGDIIIAVNNQQITGNGDLGSVLINQTPGTQVAVKVMRGSSTREFQVKLGERPTNAG